MRFKIPKDNDKYHWTQHVARKMAFYGLSPSRVQRVIRAPKRMEMGVAPGTLAAMSPYGRSPVGRQPYRGEVWVMWREEDKKARSKQRRKRIIITAWRYPGVSPVRDEVPIPAGLLEELKREHLV